MFYKIVPKITPLEIIDVETPEQAMDGFDEMVFMNGVGAYFDVVPATESDMERFGTVQ